MEITETVIEIEPTANTTLSPDLLPSSRIDDLNWRWAVWNYLRRDDWNSIKEILEKLPEGLNGTENYTGEERRNSPIHDIARYGSYLPAKLLLSKFPAMLNMVNFFGNTPIQRALDYDNTEMACYMLKLGLTHIQDPQEFELTFKNDLAFAIHKKNYDVVNILIQQYPKFAVDESAWKMLIELYDDFPCRSQLNIFQSIIYSWNHPVALMESFTPEWEEAHIHSGIRNEEFKSSGGVIHKLRKQAWKIFKIIAYHCSGRSFIQFPLIKNVRKLKSRHERALALVKNLCVGIPEPLEENCRELLHRAFDSAVQNGICEIVEEILQHFRFVIEHTKDGSNAFQFAASHRDGKLFHVLHQQMQGYDDLLWSKDVHDNNILHLVAKRAQRNRLDTGSRAVLQLQHEFQWYKEMENLLPSVLKFNKNTEGKVPLEVFDEEHKDMLKSETEWITSMANSCIVGGSLIAAVVFAAAITLPGGNNDDGHPIFYKAKAFKVFTFSDAFALVSSLTTVVTFLSIFTTRYSVESFQYDLPNRMIIGIISLLFSVIFMMIAFCATAYLLFVDDYNWIIYPAVVVSFVPVFFFSYFQFPSLLNIIKSTYGHNIFKEGQTTPSNKGKKTKKDFIQIFQKPL